MKANLRKLVESGTIDASVAKVQILSKRGTRIVVDVSKTAQRKKGPKLERIAIVPLESAGSLGEAWLPIIADIIAERGKEPVYAPNESLTKAAKATVRQCKALACQQDIAAALGARKLIAGSVRREAQGYALTLTLHDLRTFAETSRVDRKWARSSSLDGELSAAIEELFNPAPAAVATLQPRETAPPPAKVDEAPVALRTAAVGPPVYKLRTPALTLAVVGGLGAVGGAAMLVAHKVTLTNLDAATRVYNATPVRTQAQFDQLRAQENVANGLQIWGCVGLAAGVAALTTGIVLFAIDGKPESPTITVTPTGPGAQVAGRF
jgi:hypothetical protein